MASQPQPYAAEPKPLLKQREHQLSPEQLTRAKARARMARAWGKVKLAAAEWRQVIRYYESRLKTVQQMYAQGRVCSADPAHEAEGAVAVARAWLADMTDRQDVLLAELPKVIAYYEWRLRRYQILLRNKVILEHQVQHVLKDCRRKLRWARERLAGLRGDSDRLDNQGKPNRAKRQMGNRA
jgi:hypothetical protein